MSTGVSRDSDMGYLKYMYRQDVAVRRIDMSGISLQDQMKAWKPAEDVNPGNRVSSTDEDANYKTSSLLCKLLQQKAVPEVVIYCFDGSHLKYFYFMTLSS